ncbi:beta-1,3-galactosyltransferase brn [Parasteatoda tepidariorum]|uniref:beta-1,3-galactosyltransferase brn n=1 Tax=Parasteatoda tepidariorum TaxID=114398 RepID=UPI00077F9A90|nr:beta-1,3-galactosyltransferase brn [Parasteatoda tepidariorum]XP_015910541.1 beta-1,3-galactosyltransferase brn [Parasteatoda tepidariorum]
MWPIRRTFTSLIICVFLVGSVFVLLLRLKRHSPVPQFIKGAQRFRSSRVCATLATILVNSAPANAHRRQAIRETWGHIAVTRKLDIAVAFGIGEASDEILQRPVDWEAETFGDIFQSLVTEEYRTLPLKVLSLLEKVKDACDIPPFFIVKVDDDVFVNTYALKDLLKSLEAEAYDMKIWCLVWEGMPVMRNNHSKWSVSRERYPHDFYPKYCSGSAYVLNQRVLRGLLKHHSRDNLIPFEDVYITGVLAEKVGVEHVQIGTRYAFESVSEEGIASGQTIFAHLGPEADERVEHFWNFLSWKRKENLSFDGL